ncbi:MAG: hypothetical protein KGY74_07735 [Candidatus Cloacimonetes bacterium]|nr:hypothetical protein [Candidatus Cloacimonadota bacterium]
MRNKMKKTGEFIQKKCQADDYVLRISRSQKLHTRFAQNAITQHIDGENLQIKLKVAFDNKTGSASVNQTDDDSLKKLINTAEAMAKINKPDPEFVSSEKEHDLIELEEPAAATTELKVKKIVNDIKNCIENAKKKEAKLSGISQKKMNEVYLKTKNGFEGYDESATFSHSMTIKKENVETKVSRSVRDYTNFSMQEMIDKLNEQFYSLHEPRKMDKGRIPVIMRPLAFLSWLYYLMWTFRMREADEGLNPYTDQIGKQFFGKAFTLCSTTSDSQLSTPRFYGNGIPAKNIDWIKNGVIKNMQTSRYYAREKGIEPSGIYNFLVEGGDSKEEEMMQKVERGIILNNLWYIRPVDMKSGEWTGLTRDGVLYFEDGKVRNSVYNFRWNEILHDVTKRILALGPALPVEHNAKIPTVLFDDFNFVDVTTF